MFMVGLGILLYVGIAGYILIVLVRKHPHLLFNPSDYDKDVQRLLFENGPKITFATTYAQEQANVVSGLDDECAA